MIILLPLIYAKYS